MIDTLMFSPWDILPGARPHGSRGAGGGGIKRKIGGLTAAHSTHHKAGPAA